MVNKGTAVTIGYIGGHCQLCPDLRFLIYLGYCIWTLRYRPSHDGIGRWHPVTG